ncbi:MAG: FlgD immunoglobulin-like domain containing protein [Candidatus Zixiibacteriota bacterium]
MKKRIPYPLAVTITIFCLAALSIAGDKYPERPGPNPVWDQTETDSILRIDQTVWPALYAVQNTGAVRASFTCFGTIGELVPGRMTGWPGVAFESPVNSRHEYLFTAALWVGGIIGDDTLVSTGIAGWTEVGHEYYPPLYPDTGSIEIIHNAGDLSIRAEFYDTVEQRVNFEQHIPLGLKCSMKSHAWNAPAYRDMILYDLVITNFEGNDIREAYVGIYLDGDVWVWWESHGYGDDLAGSIRDRGIGYIIDNDGDMRADDPDLRNLTKCVALKLVASSQELADTNFNWWVNSALPERDFGPRRLGTIDDPFRDFGTGGVGTPSRDKNKYYTLRHPEWDYDQVYTFTVQPDDPVWSLPPAEMSPGTSKGADTKFLLSYGPVNLEPDSSLRMIFAMFTGDSVHVVADNIDNLPSNVTKYVSNLNFGDVILNSYRADELADSILNPMLPVTGLRVTYQSWDSLMVEWDPWVFDDVRHYEYYLTEVPSDSIYYPGVVPPWLRPESFDRLSPQGRSPRPKTIFTDLDPDKFYFFNVAHRSGSDVGDPGETIFLNMRERHRAPVVDRLYAPYFPGQVAQFYWRKPNISELDHFNIYRFESEDDLEDRHLPFYDRGQMLGQLQPKDSFFINDTLRYYYYAKKPFAVVGPDDTTFTVTSPVDGHAYAITAVDKHGFESDFSNAVLLLEAIPRTQDILVVTASRVIDPLFTTRDRINSFYQEVLNGYDYDIYYYADTMAALYDCWDPQAECFRWTDLARYRMVILDEDWRDVALNTDYEDRVQPFTKYLCSGGRLAFFGNLFGLNRFFSTQSQPEYYQQDHWFIQRFFGIDSLFFYPYNYYSTRTSQPYVDTCFGFIEAVSPDGTLPNLAFDTAGAPLSAFILKYWPSNTMPCVSTFIPGEAGQVTHLYKSRYPETSWLDGHPVGVRTITDEAETYLFGFHLWSIEREQARQLIDRIFDNSPTATSTSSLTELPDKFNLRQNYPNPFNPATTIVFELPHGCEVSLEIHNILGQKVRTLLSRTRLAAGSHSMEWDGTDGAGQEVASGIYFYTLKTEENTAHRKMLLVR